MTLPFGIDISAYQYSQDGSRKPDFDLINEKCDFVAVRAGISWGYTDKWFSYSWSHVLRPRLAYHVVYPGESATAQMKHFLNIVHPTQNDRLVLDMELDHGYSKARITKTLVDCMNIIQTETGRYPVIYSRAYWINQFVDVNALPEKTDWWLANYLRSNPDPYFTPEMTPPPMLPNGVKNWLIHQTSKEQDGSAVGVVSHYVDTNRWNGTHDELLAYFGLGEETPEPEPEPQEPLFQARVYSWATPYVNVVAEPSLSAGKVGFKYPLAVTDVMSTVPDWYEVPEGWMMSQFLERLDYDPPATMLAIKPLSQRDTRWSSHKLGYSYLTIGSHGCLITAISMILNWYGKSTDPAQLNDALVRVGGFTGANLYWNAIAQVQPDIYLAKSIDCYYIPAPLHEIDALLADDVPVLVHVDFNLSTPAVEQHWVLIVGKSGSDYIINDPWTGEQVSFRTKYGDPARWIFRIRAYRRQA